MPLTPRDLMRRRAHVCATDSPKLVGLSPWGGPRDVWWDKRCTADVDLIPPTMAMKVGSALERAIADTWSAEQGEEICYRNLFRVWDEDSTFAATHDALLVHKPEGLEVKTAGSDFAWGKGHDEIPDYYLVQTQHQMLVSDLERVHVCVLFGGFGLRFANYTVERDQEIIEEIVETGRRFWQHVVDGTEPLGDPPRLETLKKLKRVPNKIVELEPSLVEAWQALEADKRAAIKAADYAKAEVAAALGDAEEGDAGLFGRVTFRASERKGYTVQPSTVRTLRFQKSKLQKLRESQDEERPGAGDTARATVNAQEGATT